VRSCLSGIISRTLTGWQFCIWFVGLAALQDDGLVPDAAARALAISRTFRVLLGVVNRHHQVALAVDELAARQVDPQPRRQVLRVRPAVRLDALERHSVKG